MVKRKLLIVGTLVILFGALCACTNIVSIFEDSDTSESVNIAIVSEEISINEKENMESEITSDTKQEEESNNITSEQDVVESTGLSEKELVAIVEASCGKILEKYDYVYVDMDKDGACELMATCNEEYVHQIWFCSADGTVCEMIDENTWGFMECALKVTDTEDYALVTTQFYPDAGPYEEYIVWTAKATEVIMVTQGTGSIFINEDGSHNVIKSTYSAYWDAEMKTYYGRSWIVYFRQYDKESNQFVDVDVVKITQEEFDTYTNSNEILGDIAIRVQEWTPYNIEYMFYRTSNNKMYVQCCLYDEKENISFIYYILECEVDSFVELAEDEEALLGDLSELVEQ